MEKKMIDGTRAERIEEVEDKTPSLEPRSYKVGVVVTGEKSVIYNGLRFKTSEEADNYARDLQTRWRAVLEYEVAHSFDTPNARYPVPSDRFQIDRTKLPGWGGEEGGGS
jgi:hypothetical protein